jgi:hypothetical protein
MRPILTTFKKVIPYYILHLISSVVQLKNRMHVYKEIMKTAYLESCFPKTITTRFPRDRFKHLEWDMLQIPGATSPD